MLGLDSDVISHINEDMNIYDIDLDLDSEKPHSNLFQKKLDIDPSATAKSMFASAVTAE